MHSGMLYSLHSLSWFMACMLSVVEYLLLNPAGSLGWFSSIFFPSLAVTIFVNSLYTFDSKQIVCSSWCLFCALSWKHITIFSSFHCLGMCRSVTHVVYSWSSCFAMVSSPAFGVSMLTWSFHASIPFIFHFPQRSFHFPCHYRWYLVG